MQSGHRTLGRTGVTIPPVVFGTTCLGNLFVAMPEKAKHKLVKTWMEQMPAPVAIDSAGKYGAGMALEVLSRELSNLGVATEDVVITNKLAWRRTTLKTPEPTFEPGVWIGLENDAVQDISYDGILRCHEDGRRMLAPYRPTLISLHDPDEYLDAAQDASDRTRRRENLIGAYQALEELRDAGEVQGVGVGAKNWRVIRELSQDCDFDWVMMANSFTVLNHPPELIDFLDELHRNDVGLINSAVMHGGFLSGGEFFDYRPLDLQSDEDQHRIRWRQRFIECCREYGVIPFNAAVQFGQSHPAIHAVALSTSRPERVQGLIESVSQTINSEFWEAMRLRELISNDYHHGNLS